MDEKVFYKALLKRIVWGDGASADEIEAVANKLRETPDNENNEILLSIVGSSYDLSYRELVEQFLDHNQPNVVRKALDILCMYWHLIPDYKREILHFLKGIEGDPENECRSLAVDIAGQYLLEHRESEFLRELIDIYEDKHARMLVDAEYICATPQDEEEAYLAAMEAFEAQLLAIKAYYALAYAVGYDVTVPASSNPYDLDLKKDTDPNVLRLAKERLERELKSDLTED